jgi:hypothetical protein
MREIIFCDRCNSRAHRVIAGEPLCNRHAARLVRSKHESQRDGTIRERSTRALVGVTR